MKVSVIIPTYNRVKTIERALNSVFSQTLRPQEIIVVDSQSTDRTGEILEKYADKIRVIRQPKLGPGFARNAGIEAATGDIISFLDSDDEWLPNKTERQVALLEATKSAGVTCCVCDARMEFVSGTVSSFAAARLRPGTLEGVWTNPAQVLTTRFLFFNQVAAVRREALQQTGYFRQGIMEDYDLALRLSLTGPWAYIAEPLVVWYEQVGDNLSKTHSQLEICQRTVEILQETLNSSKWGPLLPKNLLNPRMRLLRQRIDALRLSAVSNPLTGMFGRLVLVYLETWEKLYWRLPSSPRMITKTV